MALFVPRIRANGNTRTDCAGLPASKGAAVMTGVTIVNGIGARGNTIVLVPCNKSVIIVTVQEMFAVRLCKRK